MLNGKEGVIINLGGIANITIVKNNEVFGFDTGPANTLLDNWVKKNPCPPVAISCIRKSATVVMPVCSAISAPCPICIEYLLP
jgi:hypothetical protein